MASTTPRTDTRPEPAENRPEPADAPDGAARPDAREPSADAAAPPVPMRVLLASCRAAEAVSTPPERHAA
ncbi:hypothetical protein ACFV1L_01895 [Kitasatospora sp. NPDC059646]|uniref:hypothetical protein n=1 Tax=Kitasatospora sp. NPDC059646 TaxID=3346893 RepID=UPI0036A21DC1